MSFELIEINSLQTSNLEIEVDYRDRGKYARVVYNDVENNRFLKIWRPDFYYKEYFAAAVNAGFYATIAKVTGVVHSHGDFRGYATQTGKAINWENLDKNKYRNLVDRVAQACHKFNRVYIDMHINNVVEIDGTYYLVDLEAVIPVENLGEVHGLQSALEYNDYDYRQKIKHLIRGFEPEHQTIVRQHTDGEKEIVYGTANGRIYLEKEYLPQLSGTVLFIGVNYYTDFYSRLVQQPELFQTLDVSPAVIEHGSPHGHYVCDLLDFTPPDLYDHVCFFGILGHNDDWDIHKDSTKIYDCIAKVAGLVKPGGTLLLGPATQNRPNEFWENLYNSGVLENYNVLTLRKIDINYIWHGKRIIEE